MSFLLVRHQVRDFKVWKPIFDQHAATRAAAGCKGGRMFRSSNDPNLVILLFDWDSHEHARKFSQSEELRTTMASAGVVGVPEIYFLDESEKFSR